MKKIKLSEFLAYLESHVNKSIYVWGGQGEDLSKMTEAQIRKMETSTTNANRAIALWKKRKDIKGAKAFDCSGLIMYYLSNKKKLYNDMTANGLKNICTPISKSQLRAGDLAFKCYASGHAYHVGVYNGEKVIESQGRDAGVVKRSTSANGWNKFGRPDFYADADTVDVKPAETTSTGGTCTVTTRVIKKGIKGEDVKALQILLIGKGFSCGKSGADGSCGGDTEKAIKAYQKAMGLEVDGKAGSKTWNKLING